MPKKFQRNIENFICEKCGYSVTGNGYTNHCPKCLWSKHVDIHPGDRAKTCNGLMEPKSIKLKNQEYVILHHCVRCGFEKKNTNAENDNFDEMIKISSKI